MSFRAVNRFPEHLWFESLTNPLVRVSYEFSDLVVPWLLCGLNSRNLLRGSKFAWIILQNPSLLHALRTYIFLPEYQGVRCSACVRSRAFQEVVQSPETRLPRWLSPSLPSIQALPCLQPFEYERNKNCSDQELRSNTLGNELWGFSSVLSRESLTVEKLNHDTYRSMKMTTYFWTIYPSLAVSRLSCFKVFMMSNSCFAFFSVCASYLINLAAKFFLVFLSEQDFITAYFPL